MPEIVKFWYYPKAQVEFTWSEVEDLILFSERHYDGRCRSLSKQGGILYGMRNSFSARLQIQILSIAEEAALRKNAKITFDLDNDGAQLLAKCCENNDPILLMKMIAIVRKLNDEYLRLNPREA
jgi:hypothetical protein